MALEQSAQTAHTTSKWRVKNTIIVAGVLAIAAFLAGFLPSYAKGKRLENDLRQAQQENRLAQLRDLAGVAYLEASQKNYGLAAGASARFFERTREVAAQTPQSSGRTALQDLLSGQDKITALLAKGDPGALDNLQTLFVKTRQATGIASGAAPSQ
jgi:hypothetical protein